MDSTTTTILISLLGLLGGSLCLYFGAEGLVRGSSSVAYRKGITPLVVGLTIVAFGTSSPELLVSLSAAIRGNEGMSLGNVIGSNICNIALILGIAAVIQPITVNLKVIKTDISIMIGVTLLLLFMILDGEISRLDGGILVLGIIAYNYATIRMSKKVKNKEAEQQFNEGMNPKKQKKWKDIVFIIGGIGVLVLGANLFIDGAKEIAKMLGASDVIIGLTVLAFGTSLPELATSVVAAFKGEGDISIGNAIGSNIFNLLSILGFAALVRPMTVGTIELYSSDISYVDIGVLLFVSIIIFPLAWTKFTLSRAEGAFLMLVYFAYVGFLYFKIGL